MSAGGASVSPYVALVGWTSFSRFMSSDEIWETAKWRGGWISVPVPTEVDGESTTPDMIVDPLLDSPIVAYKIDLRIVVRYMIHENVKYRGYEVLYEEERIHLTPYWVCRDY